MSTTIAIPRVEKPDDGIHRSAKKGVNRYRVWWWENGRIKSRLTKATTPGEARRERDRFHREALTQGATYRSKGARSVMARVRNAVRHRYITVQVNVRGTYVGSFATVEEAVEARDAYIEQQREIRRRLKEIRKMVNR